MEKELLKAYREIFKSKNNKPSWAVHKEVEGHTDELVHCTIPFVGKNYSKQKVKILLYASSENLAGYEDKEKLYCDDLAINRHRNYYNESVLKADRFFPNVHIAPINDGSLLTVVLYIYSKIIRLDVSTPQEFLEMIAFGNYSKYSEVKIDGGREKNIDPARVRRKLKASHEYIRKDIEVLKPDYIIMFGSIYDTDYEFIDGVKGEARIIKIYQINAGNINRIIKRKFPVGESRRVEVVGSLDNTIQEWYKHLGANGIAGKTKDNYLGVFEYVDDVLKKEGII